MLIVFFQIIITKAMHNFKAAFTKKAFKIGHLVGLNLFFKRVCYLLVFKFNGFNNALVLYRFVNIKYNIANGFYHAGAKGFNYLAAVKKIEHQ